LRFDDQLDLIEKIVPIDEKACFLIDASQNFHLKAYSKEDEASVSLQFPLPPYARNRNPKVIYSVDYLDLSRYIYKKRISVGPFGERKSRHFEFAYLGDFKLAVQLGKSNPVAVLDLHRPETSPIILEDVENVECLISVGNGCMAWYERRTNLVILYHYISRKRKILNYTKLMIEKLRCLKDNVIIAISDNNLEMLDYAKNRIIKAVGFVNKCYHCTPDFAIHQEGNIVSYLDEGYIYVCKTEKGKIVWENHYDFNEYSEEEKYIFIAHNLIAINSFYEVHILLLDSQNFSLHSKIEKPRLGIPYTPRVSARCCEDARQRSHVSSIHFLGENSVGILEILCGPNRLLHGQQRLSQFRLENLKIEDKLNQQPSVESIRFDLSKNILFEEYRDPVRAVDIVDESSAMFITERGRIFRANLKDNSVEQVVELAGLLKQREGSEIIKIDKFFVMAENRVAIVTREHDPPLVRMVIYSLETRSTDWDSKDYEESDWRDDDEAFSFFDMVRLSPRKLVLSYERMEDNTATYKLGKLVPSKAEDQYEKFELSDYDIEKANGVFFDRIWSIEDSDLLAARHAEKVFQLSFFNLNKRKFKKKLDFGNMFPATNTSNKGVQDIRSAHQTLLCIKLKTTDYESPILVYNVKTRQLVNKIADNQDILGTIRQCYRGEEGILQTMEKMIIFGPTRHYSNGLALEPMEGLMIKKSDPIEISYKFDSSSCVAPRNFKSLPSADKALFAENMHHKNFICILKSPNFKIECLRILQKACGNAYHKYLSKDVVDMIFGIK